VVNQALAALAERVIECIVEPDFEDANQAKVFGFLVQFIGNMPSNDVQRFFTICYWQFSLHGTANSHHIQHFVWIW